MTTKDPGRSPLVWRKSSYSSGNGQCVEVAFRGDRTAVRDSKHPETVVWLGAVNFGTLAIMLASRERSERARSR
jgi:hypothetical protein